MPGNRRDEGGHRLAEYHRHRNEGGGPAQGLDQANREPFPVHLADILQNSSPPVRKTWPVIAFGRQKTLISFGYTGGMATKPSTAYPSWLAQEERKSDRVAVAWQATISSVKFDAETCAILDITQLGCRIALAHGVSVGTYVTIDLPQTVRLEGWVAWNRGGEIGVDFSHPLPAELLAGIIHRNGDAAFNR